MLTTREVELREYYKEKDHFETGSIYHNEPWLDTLLGSFDCKITVLSTTTAIGETLALTPVIFFKKGPFKLFGSPLRGFYTQFLGPLFANGLSFQKKVEVIQCQTRYLFEKGAKSIEWGRSAADEKLLFDALHLKGFRYKPQSTLLVDLSIGEEAVFGAFQSRARNMIRKSIKLGVMAELSVDYEADLRDYLEALRYTFERRGLACPHPPSFYKNLLKNFCKSSEIFLIVARHANQSFLAGGIFLVHDKRMVYLSGASTKEGARLAASSLVQWRAMQRAISIGVGSYDMGGIGVESIDKFKISFGSLPFFSINSVVIFL